MSKRQKAAFGIVGVAGLIAILAILLWPKRSGEVRIGAVLPLTGDAAQWGVGARRMLHAARQASPVFQPFLLGVVSMLAGGAGRPGKLEEF